MGLKFTISIVRVHVQMHTAPVLVEVKVHDTNSGCVGGCKPVRGRRTATRVQRNIHLRIHSDQTSTWMDAYKQQCHILTIRQITFKAF